MSNEKRELLRRLTAEIRAAQRAADALDEAVADRLGLSRTELRAIDHLYPDARVTSGDLARAALLTAGAMTILLDRLEAAGYVERLRDPDDRRKVYIRLTPDGRRAVGELYAGVARLAGPIAERYSPEQLVTIISFLRSERAVNEAYAASLRGIEDIQKRVRGAGIALASRIVGEATGWASRVRGEVADELSRAAGEAAAEASRNASDPASRAQRRINEAAEAAADRIRLPAERAARRINAALDPGHPDRRRREDRDREREERDRDR